VGKVEGLEGLEDGGLDGALLGRLYQSKNKIKN
jgi:hypothetical protein